MIREGDPGVRQRNAFAFEQAALEAGEGLAHGDAAAGGDYAVPGNRLAARASGHGAAGGASSAREPNGASQLAVGDDAAPGYAFDECVHGAPAFGHAHNDSGNGGELPVLPL